MKPIQLAQITPYLFDDNLIISLDKKWIEVCDGLPKFDAIINKEGRLALIGPIVYNQNQNFREK